MKKAILLSFFIVIAGCGDCPRDSLIREQIEPYTLFGTVEDFEIINSSKNGSYCTVDVRFKLKLNPFEVKLTDRVIKDMDEDIKEAYTFYLGRVKSACGNIYEEKVCQIEEKLRFIKGYAFWYRVIKDGKFETIQLR
ncbi:hypothetical protein [Persephonella sp.]